MVETQETSVFTGDCEGNRAKLPKKRGSVMAPPRPKFKSPTTSKSVATLASLKLDKPPTFKK